MAVAEASPTLISAGNNQGQGRGQRQRRKGRVAVVLALMLGAAGVFVWLNSQRSTSASEGGAAESTLPLETFVVNLAGTNVDGVKAGGASLPASLSSGFPPGLAASPSANPSGSSQRAYLRIGITLGLGHPLPHNQPEALPTALVRDTILSVLSSAQPGVLMTPAGKGQLKNELLKALQERVPRLAVENVYFTDFLVQM